MQFLFTTIKKIKYIFHVGLSKEMPPYIYSKGYIFNILNFTGLVIASLRVIYLSVNDTNLSPEIFTLNTFPLLSCILMMLFMHIKAYKLTVYFSFIIFPVLVSFMSYYTIDRGVLAFMVPYLIYCFFFLNSKKKINLIFSIITSIFLFSILLQLYYPYKPTGSVNTDHDIVLELIGFLGSIILTYISLYSIKFQVWEYQEKIKAQKNEIESIKNDLQNQYKNLELLNITKDKLFSIIGHDLRAPLVSLELLLDSIRGDENDSSIREVLPEINTEVKKINGLFENLINWSKLQLKETKIRIRQLDIHALATKITLETQSRSNGKGVTVENSLEKTNIYGDSDILEIVLRNVVTNAIKFTKKDDKIEIKGRRDGNNFIIQVSDTGTGMSTTVLEKIKNNNFYSSPGTMHEKGTGLGLVICRDLIGQCNGTLDIESEHGKGTTLSLILPQNLN